MTLVQSKQGSGTGPSLTITLTNPTVAGNCLVVGISSNGSTTNPSVSAVTLGGVAGNFARVGVVVGTTNDAGIVTFWANPNCAGGQTSVVITQTGGSGTLALLADVHERDDIVAATPFDKQSSGGIGNGSTTWDSIATATTTQANEVFYGIVTCVTNSGPTLTGPGAPWANDAVMTQAYGGFTSKVLVGYQSVSATGTARYNGTSSPASDYVALAVTLKRSAGAAVGILPQQAKKRMPAVFTRISAPSRGGVYSR